MKIIIFSDTHLTTDFEEDRFRFLKHIISQADKVIINGDFWEGWQITFSEFIESPWNKLFPFLKGKETIYLYGNHDKKEYCDKRVFLFSSHQATHYKFKIGNQSFFVEHGDRINFAYKKLFYKQFFKSISHYPFFVKRAALLEKIIVKSGLKRLLDRNGRLLTFEIIKQRDHEKGNSEIYICGHTHLGFYDKKHQFLNDGFIRHGVGQYVEINEKGEVFLRDMNYSTK
ncbi:MAG: metallophosphoesterase family protein [Candidatus Levyibacteriota bacterium]